MLCWMCTRTHSGLCSWWRFYWPLKCPMISHLQVLGNKFRGYHEMNPKPLSYKVTILTTLYHHHPNNNVVMIFLQSHWLPFEKLQWEADEAKKIINQALLLLSSTTRERLRCFRFRKSLDVSADVKKKWPKAIFDHKDEKSNWNIFFFI